MRRLSDVKITSLPKLQEAITKLHRTHHIPHIIITSVSFGTQEGTESSETLSVVGSTRRADGSPRFFKIDVPKINSFFSGIGDMFAALILVRLREAVMSADPSLSKTRSWISPDEVTALDLPLTKATEKVLGSMHLVLNKTKEAMNSQMKDMVVKLETKEDSELRTRLRIAKASEVRLVRNVEDLKNPGITFKATSPGQ